MKHWIGIIIGVAALLTVLLSVLTRYRKRTV